MDPEQPIVLEDKGHVRRSHQSYPRGLALINKLPLPPQLHHSIKGCLKSHLCRKWPPGKENLQRHPTYEHLFELRDQEERRQHPTQLLCQKCTTIRR